MKKLLLFILLAAVGKVAFDRVMNHRSAEKVDETMARLAAEMNQNLPPPDEYFRLEGVEYSNRVLRYAGATLHGREFSEQAKAAKRQQLTNVYCNGPVFRKANVSVEYAIRKDGIATLGDKVSNETWSFKVGPQDCI